MITVKQLQAIMDVLPDDAELVAFEGEGSGIGVWSDGLEGYIETGPDGEPCDPQFHDLKDFGCCGLHAWSPLAGDYVQ